MRKGKKGLNPPVLRKRRAGEGLRSLVQRRKIMSMKTELVSTSSG